MDTEDEVDRNLLLVLSRKKQIARALASLVYENLMQSTLPRPRHVLLALDHDIQLITNILQPPQHLSVAIGEVEDRVRHTSVVAELPDHELHLAQVMARHTREQVVNSLELETAVHKVHPRGAVDVHGGAELTLRKGLGLAEVNG